jgi:tetraacyldisaccharide 4'-kinase
MDISPEQRRILSGEAQGVGSACLRLGLFVVSLLYGFGVGVRNWLYNTGLRAERRIDKPVICIGNITAGGTGKTPAVEYAVRWFLEHGARPAVVSRGYGAKDGQNDEALLLAAHLPGVPHRQDPKRFRAAVHAVRLDNANVVILDDGFQHRRLARFANVVLIDATCPFGYGHLIPRGLLREPLKELRRADAIIITRCDLVEPEALERITERLAGIVPDTPIATAAHRPASITAFPDGVEQDPSVVAGKQVGIFSSIGNPAAFRGTVEQLGASVAWCGEFPDHHWYSQADIAAIVRADNAPVDLFVTTEKDAVKLGSLDWPKDRRLLVLRVEMKIRSGEPALTTLFEEALNAANYVEN